MGTVAIGTGQGAGSNILAFMGSRYVIEFGLGPESKQVVLRAMSRLDITGNTKGSILMPDSTYRGLLKPQNRSGRRPINGQFPTGDPTTMLEIPVKTGPVGLPFRLDYADPKIKALRASAGGDQAVEEYGVQQSVRNLLSVLQYYWLFPLRSAASTPFDASDVNCTATKWNAATTAIVAQFSTAIQNAGGRRGFLNALLVDTKAEALLRDSLELNTRFGGASGATLDPNWFTRVLLAQFGVNTVFVVDQTVDPLAATAVLFRTGDAMDGQQAPTFPLPWTPPQDQSPDEFGVCYKVEEVPLTGGQVQLYTAFMETDVTTVVPSVGVRMTNLY